MKCCQSTVSAGRRPPRDRDSDRAGVMLRVDGKLCGVAPEEGADEQARLMEFVVPTLSAVVGRLEALEEVRARADARADTGETTKPVDELYQTYEGTLRAQVAVAAATLPAVLKRLDVLERSIDPASARARESDAHSKASSCSSCTTV